VRLLVRAAVAVAVTLAAVALGATPAQAVPSGWYMSRYTPSRVCNA